MFSSTSNKQTLVFSREALQAIDTDAVEQYNIPSIVLMENAGRGAAEILVKTIAEPLLATIVVVCGSGNNGGDGYVVARHLSNNGCGVSILQVAKPKTQDAITNATICDSMGIHIEDWSSDCASNATLLIDALFGTGLDRTVEGMNSQVIQSMNESNATCIALDIPSGLDCDSGRPLGCSIHATMTVSFVGLKKGFLNKSAGKYIGEVLISSIGCPPISTMLGMLYCSTASVSIA